MAIVTLVSCQGHFSATQGSPFKVFDARIGRGKQGETEEQREQLGSGIDLPDSVRTFQTRSQTRGMDVSYRLVW
jgi:hypothetical protein